MRRDVRAVMSFRPLALCQDPWHKQALPVVRHSTCVTRCMAEIECHAGCVKAADVIARVIAEGDVKRD